MSFLNGKCNLILNFIIVSFLFQKSTKFSFDTNPVTRHTVFSVVIGGFFYWVSLLCTNQASVQKCMSLKSEKKANIALTMSIIGMHLNDEFPFFLNLEHSKTFMYLNAIGVVLIFVVNFYTGLTLYAHYKSCSPLVSGEIGAKDELLPFYIMDVLTHIPFVNGFFVAGIFAASLG